MCIMGFVQVMNSLKCHPSSRPNPPRRGKVGTTKMDSRGVLRHIRGPNYLLHEGAP